MKRFSIGKHMETGLLLKKINDDLQCLLTDILNSYPKSSKQAIKGRKAVNALNELRSSLDDCVCQYKELSDRQAVNIYYGNMKSNEKIEE